jgi:hypothetical protein
MSNPQLWQILDSHRKKTKRYKIFFMKMTVNKKKNRNSSKKQVTGTLNQT